MPETMIRLSLSETARRHGIDKGQLSRDVRAGKENSRGFPICQYVVRGLDGRIHGFEFPNSYAFPGFSKIQQRSERKGVGVATALVIGSIGLAGWLARKYVQSH